MLQTAAGIFVVWLVGVISGYTLGGFLHLLPVAAVALVLIWMMEGGAKVRVRSRK